MRRPFEATPEELSASLEQFVDATYLDLESDFLVLPRGPGLVEYPRFQEAYECLKQATAAFHDFSPETVWTAMLKDSLVFLVLRTILGLSAPEWAYLASAETDVRVEQGQSRVIDRAVRVNPDYVARLQTRPGTGLTLGRIQALVQIACKYITATAPSGAADTVHRLDKVDTADGLISLQNAASLHVPYAVLLYERYLGSPFASHRNAVSGMIGDVMETAIEHRLQEANITYRKTGRAERVHGFDQAPDFIIPTEFAPEVVIEAKITNDDGTARDKFTRLIHLAELSQQRVLRGERGFEVVACIDGRGFGVRRQDMRRLLAAVQGKVFTLRSLDRLVSHTRLAGFASRQTPGPG